MELPSLTRFQPSVKNRNRGILLRESSRIEVPHPIVFETVRRNVTVCGPQPGIEVEK
jgi:hypothetical protein